MSAGVTVASGPCPACGSSPLQTFFRESSVPTNSCLLLDDPEQSIDFPRGTIALGFCEECGFITNTHFEPGAAEYSQRYEETQAFSPLFVGFAEELAKRWVDKHQLHDKTVVEIGCGKGEFLVLMAEAGAGHCIGIDPGVHPDRINSSHGDRIEWIVDFYDESYGSLEADAVICRHTLEHIPDVFAFMTMIRSAIGDRPSTVVLFELPDVQRILDEVAFWDIYYEHCSYFSLGSLARLFRATGFEVLDLSVEYDGQYLLIEARPSPVPTTGAPLDAENDLSTLTKGVEHFRHGYDQLVATWTTRLSELIEGGGKAVIWGSGSKGVSFISNLGLTDEILGAVDINPNKWGKYMVGSDHPILSPSALVDLDPDLVIVMNPIYLDEISKSLADMGLTCDVEAV